MPLKNFSMLASDECHKKYIRKFLFFLQIIVWILGNRKLPTLKNLILIKCNFLCYLNERLDGKTCRKNMTIYEQTISKRKYMKMMLFLLPYKLNFITWRVEQDLKKSLPTYMAYDSMTDSTAMVIILFQVQAFMS